MHENELNESLPAQARPAESHGHGVRRYLLGAGRGRAETAQAAEPEGSA